MKYILVYSTTFFNIISKTFLQQDIEVQKEMYCDVSEVQVPL